MVAILGISAFYHDSAAAIVVDGEIIAAAQEERYTKKKHDCSYPRNAISYVLAEAGLTVSQVDYVAFYDKPFLKFERLLETYIAYAPRGLKQFSMAMPVWLREKLYLKNQLLRQLRKLEKGFNPDKLLFGEHHVSHAASAFFPSPFNEAVVLTLDGVGEWATTTVAIGRGNKLSIIKEIHFPHSLGLLYSAFTYYTGFRVNSGEYKVMGLAPYGKPRYKDIILEELIDLKKDGSFRLNQSYFNYATGLTMTNSKFTKLFGENVRKPESDELSQFHMDIAASIQKVIEIVLLRLTRTLAMEFNISNLCMAGGVALNCVANGKIKNDRRFKEIWIQPAAGDAGGALGVALTVWYKKLNKSRTINKSDAMKGSYLGPKYSNIYIEKQLSYLGANYIKLTDEQVLEKTAKALVDGKAVGWFQGRMEFGPRALGSRSILGDPQSEKMQKMLNLKVKYRESFRPFAPSVLQDDVYEWFDFNDKSPYMLFVGEVKKDKRLKISNNEKGLFGIEKLNVKRSEIPAVTHVDYSARIQTVSKETNPLYHSLISKFKDKTGCPVVVNTSFNIRGEPIVCSPKDAYNCFMGTELDILVIGNYFLIKENQCFQNDLDYRKQYNLD